MSRCIENIDAQVCQPYAKKDEKEIAQVFGRAFQSYPLFKDTLPNTSKRVDQLSTLHRVLTCYASRHGKVYTTANKESVLITTIQNGSHVNNFSMLQCGAIKIPLTLGSTFLRRNEAYEKAMAELHQKSMPQKHFYFWAIATEPSEQGKGHARRLAEKALQDAHKLQLPVYCETADPHNVEIYKKMGLKVVGSRTVGSLTTWGMTL